MVWTIGNAAFIPEVYLNSLLAMYMNQANVLSGYEAHVPKFTISAQFSRISPPDAAKR